MRKNIATATLIGLALAVTATVGLAPESPITKEAKPSTRHYCQEDEVRLVTVNAVAKKILTDSCVPADNLGDAYTKSAADAALNECKPNRAVVETMLGDAWVETTYWCQ